MIDREADLTLARRLGEIAAEIALRFVDRIGHVQTKADGSPVGEADLAIDAELVRMLQHERPQDAILSEESGEFGHASRRWLLDPLDGTSMFVEGQPGWGTMLTLQDDGRSVLSVVTRPLEGRSWWAVRGCGAYRGDLGADGSAERISVDERSIDRARLTAWGGLYASARFRGASTASIDPDPEISTLCQLAGWVDPHPDAFLRLAEGELDAVVSLGGLVWDHAPVVLLVEEAGGVFHDRAGGDRLDLLGGIYSNRALSRVMGELVAWY
jgi:histidinol-phosphatase